MLKLPPPAGSSPRWWQLWLLRKERWTAMRSACFAIWCLFFARLFTSYVTAPWLVFGLAAIMLLVSDTMPRRWERPVALLRAAGTLLMVAAALLLVLLAQQWEPAVIILLGLAASLWRWYRRVPRLLR